MNNKKCPCCDSKISFWHYFNEDNFKDSKNSDKHIRCKECKNIILLSWRSRFFTSIGVLLVFATSMYLFIENNLSWFWISTLLVFIFFTSYVSYIAETFICYNEKKLEREEKSNFGGIIFAIIVLIGAFVIFWTIFSFAIDMKAKNHQKHKVEHTIKDKK